ncbi:hypothetical protein D187_008957 [Cystobacter fuscus DSM 2262]|uniref:DUF4340 domain-containing protein n=1 Tax=Cystobacter fuscus (strain ATCC 25194 / DSM 2262 / NBRC 100088 / M29) TaxID=1242864 RepID=S9QNA9_CYSF2|nr:DUF4340 domain-containing protein [Cystobacter fuscus]EPX62769.1 hypothetical protein D187_008957 [Cystobacter fuscus DSM 2262]
MNKTTIIVLGIFAVLLVAVLATREDHVSVGVRKLELPRVDKDKVSSIELSGARSARLEKEGDGWRVVDPAKPEQKYVADESLVTSALDALGELRHPDFVTDRAETHAEYELDDAKGLKLKVVQSGTPAIELVLGKAAKNGGAYVREAGKNEVFVARGRLDWTVRKDVKGWRKRALLSLKPEDLTQLTLRSKDGEVLTLNAGSKPGEWSVAEGTTLPPNFRFDPGLAEQVARQLSSLSAQDFLEGEAAADPATGLGGAHDTVEAKLKDGKTIAVHLAPAGKDGATVAARLEGDPQVYQLAAYSADALRKRLTDLRDLRLFHFEQPKVTRFKLQAGPTAVQVAREGTEWKVIEPRTLPTGFEFDASQVESLLSWLGSLRAARVVDGTPSEAQLGVNTPTALVEISIEASPSQTLRLGKEAPGSAAGVKELYARTSIDPLAYALPEYVKTRLAQGLQLFKKPEMPRGGPSQIGGLDQLPPEVRQQLEAQLRARQMQ